MVIDRLPGRLWLARGIVSSPLLNSIRHTQRWVWVTLLCLANWRPSKVWVGGMEVEIPAGSALITVRNLAEKAGVSKSCAERALALFERAGMVGFTDLGTGTKGGTTVRMINVLNWQKYQTLDDDDRDNFRDNREDNREDHHKKGRSIDGRGLGDVSPTEDRRTRPRLAARDPQLALEVQTPPRDYRPYFSLLDKLMVSIGRPGYRASPVDRKLVMLAAERSPAEQPEVVAARIEFGFKSRKCNTWAQALSKKTRDSLTVEDERYVQSKAAIFRHAARQPGSPSAAPVVGGNGAVREGPSPDADRLPDVREDDAPVERPVRLAGRKTRSLQDLAVAYLGAQPGSVGQAGVLGGPRQAALAADELAPVASHGDSEEPTH